ncbi:MAG: AmmeMemoRadiSam system protein B [Sphaerochaeta sp.]|nr:AmmeMemoRadiSam system protein B [Sphaerochaeta sp.]
MLKANTSAQAMRRAKFAGSWYPQDTHVLENLIEQAFSALSGQFSPPTCAVLPHAGISYSALGMAPFFNHLPPQAERLVLLAPSHTTSLNPDRLVGGSFTGYATPLGTLQGFSLPSVNRGFDQAIEREHAVEMAMPFIAYLNKKREKQISFSPALISKVTNGFALSELCDNLVADIGLDELKSGRTLLVASSDFTHYGRRFGYAPYARFSADEQRSKVKEDDLTLAGLLAKGRSGEALAFYGEKKLTVCGIAPSLIVSEIARRLGLAGSIASYYTSSDIDPTGGDSFVAYCTILWS